MSVFSIVKCGRCDGTGKVHMADLTGMRKARDRAGLTLVEMAERLNLSASYIHDIEHGKRACPKDVLEAYQKL
jgi:predicted transcriptional regulator